MIEYPNYKKSRCVHCEAGLPLVSPTSTWHYNFNERPKCTAPTPELYIAELEAQLEVATKGLSDEAGSCDHCNGTGTILFRNFSGLPERQKCVSCEALRSALTQPAILAHRERREKLEAVVEISRKRLTHRETGKNRIALREALAAWDAIK